MTIEGEGLLEVRSAPIPRVVEILKIPADGPRPVEEVLSLLAELGVMNPDVRVDARPYLEVNVVVSKPEPSLRRRIELALAGKAPRLVRIGVQLEGSGLPLADAYASASLKQLMAEDVFRQCYRRKYPEDPPAELIEAYHELLERVEADEA